MFGVSTNLRACRKSATGWCMAACQTKAVANAIINKIFEQGKQFCYSKMQKLLY